MCKPAHKNMPETNPYQLKSICEIGDEAVQWVVQSEFDITEEEAKLILKDNGEKLRTAIIEAVRKTLPDLIGRPTRE